MKSSSLVLNPPTNLNFQNEIYFVDKKEESETLKKGEMVMASSLSHTLKNAMTADMVKICEKYYLNKITAKFRSFAKNESHTGEIRPLYVSKYGAQLKGFEFNVKSPLKKTFKAKFFIKNGSRRGHIILHFPAFSPLKKLKPPKLATNFKINARLIALSDFGLSKEDETHQPLCKKYHGKFAHFESNMLPLLKMPIDPITSQLSIDTLSIPEENTSLLLLMSVHFYRLEKGQFSLLNEDSSLQIIDVF